MSENEGNTSAAGVYNPANLVDYQPGTVVSRTLMDKKAGSITLFAFDETQGLKEHTTPFDALVHVLEGEVEIKISGQSHVVKGGQSIIMPADEPHALQALSNFKMMLVMIKGA
jgi:quercetin dioxygenase-like cupin family protein